MCRGMLGSSQRSSPPSASPKGSQLSGANRKLGQHPLLLCHPHALLFKTASYVVACWNTPQQSKQTDESNLSTLRTYCIARQLNSSLDPEIFDPLHMRCGNTCEVVIEDFGKKKKKLIATVIFFSRNKAYVLTDVAF